VRALVTGGCGLIGSHIVDLLLRRGDDVRVLDSLDPETHPTGRPTWTPSDIHLVVGDVASPDVLRRALAGIDAVFHQAAFGGFTPELSRYVETNCLGTVRLLEVIATDRLPVSKIVVASSQAIYGEGQYRCADDGVVMPPLRPLERLDRAEWEVPCPVCDADLDPMPTPEPKRADGRTMYALSKHATERWSLELGRAMRLPVTALRYAVTFGPRQSIFNPYTGVISIFATRIANGLAPVLYEDGRQSRDFVFVEDVAAANVHVMNTPAADYRTFNVGTGRGVTMRDVALGVGRALGREVEPALHGDFRPADVRHFVHDSSSLNALGWRPAVTFEQGLERFADWFGDLGPVEERFTTAQRRLVAHGVVRRSGSAS
jgi:dTDP-L-rhamnose 4-epimerase